MNRQRLLELAGVIEAPYRAGSGKSQSLLEMQRSGSMVSNGRRDVPVGNTHIEITDGEDYAEMEVTARWVDEPGQRQTQMDPGFPGERSVEDITLAAPVTLGGQSYSRLTIELMAMALSAHSGKRVLPGSRTEDDFIEMVVDVHGDTAVSGRFEDDRY